MLSQMLYIAGGAVLGAWARFGMMLWLNPLFLRLPLGTLLVNLTGSYIIGFFFPFVGKYLVVSMSLRSFIITGFLATYTTFSTFSAETLYLFYRGDVVAGVVCVLAHVIGSLLMTYLGMLTIKAVFFFYG